MKIPVIIDCDPGHDDAVALLLAFSSPALEVKGVTVTGGNQTLVKTLNNAKRILSYGGIETLIAKGADRPMLRELEIAPQVHGDSGLDGPVIPEAEDYPVDPRPAAEFMRDLIMASQEKITIVATGPLTNLGILLTLYPQVKERIRQISIMGGAIVGGNWTPGAEFNILVDPEAAKIVFESGIPLIMSGLDVTHRAQIYPEDVEQFRQAGGRIPVFFAELLDFFSKFHQGDGQFKGSPLHDPCAVAWLIDPSLFAYKDYYVEIETRGEFTTGATVADFFGVRGKAPNARVLVDIDREGFVDLLYQSMTSYKEV